MRILENVTEIAALGAGGTIEINGNQANGRMMKSLASGEMTKIILIYYLAAQ